MSDMIEVTIKSNLISGTFTFNKSSKATAFVRRIGKSYENHYFDSFGTSKKRHYFNKLNKEDKLIVQIKTIHKPCLKKKTRSNRTML